MSGAARSVAAKHLQGVLHRWPKDPLRPNCQLQDVLARRLGKGALTPAVRGTGQGQADLKQTNALYSLLEDRYKNKYRAAAKMFEPESNPAYYKELIKELEEAPNRSFFGRIAKRLSGMIRLT
ncbi:Cytochrome B pre-mRNA-processing protein 6 [Madurella mycetomatis]|uniref:Cytochrome B pre-mRNA-processing protein 6 n=1 Tax=Madurella mycetomatis TaxID=100816 RepID=A0A175WCC8_9PEZI|nr:Cytochrome B pre-mRNA-processing protein 6 [Madurella mycetomatis]